MEKELLILVVPLIGMGVEGLNDSLNQIMIGGNHEQSKHPSESKLSPVAVILE